MADNNHVKKGKCLNIGNCNNANIKKVLEIDTLEEFVCPDCGTELVEIKAKKSNSGLLIGVIVGVLLIGGSLTAWMLSGNKEVVPPTGVTYTEIPDKEEIPEEVVHLTSLEEVTPEPESEEGGYVVIEKETPGEDIKDNGEGTISLSYGKYSGTIKNGKANGTGTLQYFKKHRISTHDNKERYAEEGDYITGTFKDNEVVQAKWYGKDKVQKGTIIIGSVGVP